MTQYAERSKVSVASSKQEIEEIVTRYCGAAINFATVMRDGTAMILFEAKSRQVRFEVTLPSMAEFAKVTKWGKEREATPEQMHGSYEQACRQRWRALALVIKAKLEAVESGISTFEQEFMGNIVLPNGKTVGQWMAPQLEQAYANNKMPPMLQLGSGKS
jgi:hypothetical protein